NLVGQPLTPTGIQQLIVELFAGKTVERKEIIKVIPRIHQERGGLPARGNIDSSVKKALQYLARSSLADKLDTPGFWRIKYGELNKCELSAFEPVIDVDNIEVRPQAEKTIGNGEAAVYLYFFPTYRLYANQMGETSWPCKIGRTNGEASDRVYGQIGTALPEE